ncbi:MAG: KPN_02809 family neutral zinc metallopeptidase [Thermoanaerobaculia bacterium]
MRWTGGRRSGNVEDRRGMGGPLIAGGGIGTIVIALLVMFLGGDPEVVLQQAPQASGGGGPESRPAEENQLADFVSVVLADTEDTWNAALPQQAGRNYVEPKLVLFTGATQSGCGVGQAAMGPFYCPVDQSVYIDLGFYGELQNRFGANGDFAQAYVVAHEVGHHVQNLLGVSEQVHGMRGRVSEEEFNAISVRQELQADCYAGIWANHAQRSRQVLEQGDLEEALNAAAAIGDDNIQRQTQGRVSPESFTHGSSAQRARWFRQGFESGDLRSCDTFRASQL